VHNPIHCKDYKRKNQLVSGGGKNCDLNIIIDGSDDRRNGRLSLETKVE
jgi:hypothetical protein